MIAPILFLLLFVANGDAGRKSRKFGSRGVKLEADWDYSKNGKDWPNLCASGKSQSPIDLKTKEAIRAIPPRLELMDYQNKFDWGLSIRNIGNTVSMLIGNWKNYYSGAWTTPYLRGSILRGKYKAEALHVHWGSAQTRGSEHMIDGKLFDMELHIMHYATKYSNYQEALGKVNGIAMLAILVQLDKNADTKIMDEFFEALPFIKTYKKQQHLPHGTNLYPLMRALDTSKYFIYQGSLTTPNCVEDVVWLVLRTPITINYKLAANLWQLNNTQGKPLLNNFRVQQKANERLVLLV